MENKDFVIGLLESKLGKGKPDKHGNVSFFCPFCNHRKRKLIVHIESGKYNCWTCEAATKGKSPVSLLKKMGASADEQREMKSYYANSTDSIDDRLNISVSLPKECKSLLENTNSPERKRALKYLKTDRKITEEDIMKYNIQYCEKGRYKNRVIVPSYDSVGKLNYFIARSFEDNPFLAYDAPRCNKSEIVGFESSVNWDVPIILCEGAFDAMAFKRNAIPLFGKTITKALMLKLVASRVKTVYLALDKDAYNQCINYAEQLMNLGKEVYFLDMEDKDPGVIGFKNLTKLLHKAKPLSLSDLLMRKLMKI
jgi:transcription elongation factor Elf1